MSSYDARKELHERMDRWASWARSPENRPTAPSDVAGYLKERLDQAHDSAEFTKEIENTERAVARTWLEDKAYKRIIKCYWLGRLSFIEIAMKYHTSESGTKQLFDEAMSRVENNLTNVEKRLDRIGNI